jgi:glycosyltransferase involved in cell wall biosynthesis
MFGHKKLKTESQNGLLIVSGIFPPDIGGPALFASNFRRWEISKSKLVNLVTLSDNRGSKEISANGEIRRVSRNDFFFLRTIKIVWSIVILSRKSSSILVVGCFVESYFASFFSNKKRVVKVPGDIVWERARNSGLTHLDITRFQDERLNLKYRFFRWIFTKSLRSADAVITPSEFLRTLCMKWGVESSKIRLVYNGVSVEDFSPKMELFRDIQVLTVCRLTRWKGLEGLILACRDLGLPLNIVGSGPLRLELENFARTQNAKVLFMGEKSEMELQKIYSRSRFFVLNSSYEGLPHSLLEAMASGCVAVAKSGTGSAEVITHEINGYLADFDNDFSLRDILNKLSDNFESLSKVREAARLTVISKFNRNKSYEEINGIIF